MRVLFSTLLWLILASTTLATGVSGHAELKANITVLVDENLMLSMASLARAYSKISNTPLTILVKQSAEIESEIGQGLEAHLLLTRDGALVNRLMQQGMTDVSSTRPVARAQLALVANRALGQQKRLANHISFAAILYATPDMPVFVEAQPGGTGNAAQGLLKDFEFSTQLQSRLQIKESQAELVLALKTTPALGLMLVPDALAQPDLTILSILPETISPSVRYEALVLASESMEDAREFTRF